MKYNGIPTACESFSYGQVEDYTVNITAVGTIEEPVINDIAFATDNAGSEITVYPNPVDNELSISLANKTGTTFTITNTLGQQVRSGQLSENPIDVSDLGTGIYLIELKGSQKTVTKKFIKK
jgi:bacillolysin